jgi:chromate reductase
MCDDHAMESGTAKRSEVRFLVFSASLRESSLNTRLAELAATTIEGDGGTVERASMAQFDCPTYSQDTQVHEGFPPGAEELYRRLQACDAFVVASPEYNASMPGGLKNAIDWVSRYDPQPFNERHGLVMSASPSMGGGNRGLWTLRIPFEHLGARVYPDMFSLAQAHRAFDAEGRIADPHLQERFDTHIINFMDLVEASKHYPCIKRHWVEYLGEHPEPAIDRVQ